MAEQQTPLALRSNRLGLFLHVLSEKAWCGTFEELEAITPEEFMGRIIGRLMGSRITPAQDPNSAVRVLRVVIGESHETENLAHVVYRRILQAPDRAQLIEPISVVTLRRTGAGWRVPGPNRLTRSGVGWSGVRLEEGPWLA